MTSDRAIYIHENVIIHDGEIVCEVTGRRKRGKGLEVPCAYKFFRCETMVMKMKELIHTKR